MIESIRAINKAVRVVNKTAKKNILNRTFTIQEIRKNSDLEYPALKSTLFHMAKLQVIELLHGDPSGKTNQDMIESNQKNIPYINIQYHTPTTDIESVYYENQISELKQKNESLEIQKKEIEKEYNELKQDNFDLAVKKNGQIKQLQEQVDELNKRNRKLHDKNKALLAKNTNTKTVPEPDSIPDKINVNGELWSTQIKQGKYVYVFKRLDKVYSISLGKVSKFNLDKAIEKIKIYKQKKKLFTNR